MAKKIEYIKYLGMGAGAVLAPKLVGMVPQVGEMLANVPFVGDPLWEGITAVSVVFAGLGVALVDMLMNK